MAYDTEWERFLSYITVKPVDTLDQRPAFVTGGSLRRDAYFVNPQPSGVPEINFPTLASAIHGRRRIGTTAVRTTQRAAP